MSRWHSRINGVPRLTVQDHADDVAYFDLVALAGHSTVAAIQTSPGRWVHLDTDDLRAVVDHLSMALAPAEMVDDAATEAAHDVEVAALATEDDAEVEWWVAFAATLKRRLEMLLTADRNWSVLSHTDDAMLVLTRRHQRRAAASARRPQGPAVRPATSAPAPFRPLGVVSASIADYPVAVVVGNHGQSVRLDFAALTPDALQRLTAALLDACERLESYGNGLTR
jgi:hypothetical protein